MTGRRRFEEDAVDRACGSWAYQWVRAFANPPSSAGQMVGPLNCTLGRVRELHDGASSTTESARSWPEVFIGEGLLVAIALKAMSELSRQVIFRHYVERWYVGQGANWVRRARPIKQLVIAERLGISLSHYYVLRDCSKSCVSVVLSLDTEVLARARPERVQTAQVRLVS